MTAFTGALLVLVHVCVLVDSAVTAVDACLCRYYVLQNSFSAAGRSLLLARSLRVRLWDDSNAAVRQLPSVGKLLGARLAAAGLGRCVYVVLIVCRTALHCVCAAKQQQP
jgi:hypothetical protein